MSYADYLVLPSSGIYHFRYIHKYHGKRAAIKLSLKTRCKRIARKNALLLSELCKSLLRDICHMKALEELKAVRDHIAEDNSQLGVDAVRKAMIAIDLLEKKATWVQVNLTLLEKNIDSLTLKKVISLYSKHHIGLNKALEVAEKKQLESIYKQIADSRFPSEPSADKLSMAPSKAQKESLSISEVWDKYIEEAKRAKKAPSTIRDYEVAKSIITGLLSTHKVSEINKSVVRDFKESLLKMPANASKIKLFKGLSLLECTKLEHDQNLISTATVNKYLKQFSAVMAWSINNGYYLDTNPVQGTAIKQSKRTIDSRKPFDANDLKVIFEQSLFQNDNPERVARPYKFWLPLLALYTGARLAELCQLYLKDINLKSAIPHLTLREEAEDQRLKTDSGWRVIPIHSHLIDIGFEHFVSALEKKGEVRLFPEIKKSRHSYSTNPSKYFSKAFQKLNFDETKVFHSFRHTFSNELKKLGVQEAIAANLMGHSHKQLTYGHYGADADLEMMKDAIDKLKFNEICTHLRW
ncbi:site-specific integrase [Nitrincola schmidtii]|uniref:site-specific integrase n=1 Tax=Nitrincola schmidtii TaxID=1730894 RepID=UPI00124EBF3E|nr:site-specific integrase [Nitrincola schmidtii]